MRPIVLQILACALIAAGALRPGERLATSAGAAVVEYVTVQPGERRVYNLSVEGDHRYLVGELGVVVHNTLPCPSGRSLADIVADDTAFMRWLKRGHPIDQPLSASNARLIWDKLVALGMSPVLHPSGQSGRYFRGPHINVIVGTRNIHIPVEAGFVS
jgi:hypothetical protein